MQMPLYIAVIVVLWAVLLTFVGPTVTPYSRKQWALFLTTLIILWIPMSCYLIFVVGQSEHVDVQQGVRAAALNLMVGVPLLIFITMKWILKKW